MEIDKKRIEWIDTAKGLGIICIIVSHFNLESINAEWFRAIIQIFDVPLFFFLSGYMFKDNLDFKSFLLKKTKSLVVPYFCIGAFLLLFNFAFKYGFSFTTDFLKEIVKFFMARRMFTIWFFVALFFSELIFYFLVKYLKKVKKIFLAVVFLTVLIFVYYEIMGNVFPKLMMLPMNLDISVASLPFMFAGYFLRKNKKMSSFVFKKQNFKYVFPLCSILGVLLALINYFVTGKCLNMFLCEYGIKLISYTASVFAVIGAILLSKKIRIKTFAYIGRNSVVYFTLHQTIFMPVSEFVLKKLNVFTTNSLADKYMFMFVNFVLVLLFCTVVSVCVNEIKLRFALNKKILAKK